MKISVILPVYNTARYLEGVVHALRNQDYPKNRYELIFVDNGSKDNSLEILRKHPDLNVLSEYERGSYAARNRGLSHARGEILAFTDSDCFPRPGWLKSIEKAFLIGTTEVVLGPRIPFEGNSWVRLLAEYENRKTESICESNDPSVYYGYTNNMAVRASTMEKIGPFVHLKRGSDTIFVRQVTQTLSCDAVIYHPEMAVQHAEFNSIGVYFKKMRTYGRSRTASHHIMPVRSLNFSERWNIFRRTADQLGLMNSMRLFSLLAVGAVAWWWGLYGVSRQNTN